MSSTKSTRCPSLTRFDLGVCGRNPWAASDILHRQAKPVCHPSGECDARRLATRHRVERFEADIAGDGRNTEIHQRVGVRAGRISIAGNRYRRELARPEVKMKGLSV